MTSFIRQLFIWILVASVSEAAGLAIQISPRFEGKRLQAGSLRYQTSKKEVFSITRLSLLCDEFALRDTSGNWHTLPDQFAFFDLGIRRLNTVLEKLPDLEFEAIRFSVGVAEDTNHGKSTSYAADHPLNPNLNRMHWSWEDGYIFLALEGRYRKPDKSLSGFVYHLANDGNMAQIELPLPGLIKGASDINIAFDIQALFNGPRPITFAETGNSTHSHEGDPLAGSLRTNLGTAFSIDSIRGRPQAKPQRTVRPLYLPDRPQGYPFKMASTFPKPPLPLDNPLLKGRVALGKKLFHDPSLSRDGSISCSSCHLQEHAFSDPRRYSLGVGGSSGTFNSMPLFNLAWKSSFFWDGRAKSLREQVLEPLQDPNEMGETLENVVAKVNSAYPAEIHAAFGDGDVSIEKIGLALESFLFTLTSYDSKFDRAMRGEIALAEDERRGFELFFTEYEPRSRNYGADCFHCHGGALFSDHGFHNNGLENSTGRFATPSLRNVALTAPYMHDGRFPTLEDVVEHYNSGLHRSDKLDPNLAKHPPAGLGLSISDKKAIVAFLKSLTDDKFRSRK